jgi:two-component system, NarL family, nitrate/nitrite sensor histidine kinase NarX
MNLLRSFRGQFTLIFLGFLLLVGSSAAATFRVIQQQESDAVILNLAGRQRMLTQQMVWLALSPANERELEAARGRFDETLAALRFGGRVLDAHGRLVDLPPAPTAELQSQLSEVAETWLLLQEALAAGDAATLAAGSSRMLGQLDVVVTTFEANARAKVDRLWQLQLLFLLAALFLLVGGYYFIHYRLLRRLALLATAVKRVGREPSWQPPPVAGVDELGQLADAFRYMAAEIAAARDSLEARVAQRTRELAAAFEFSRETAQQLELEHLFRSAAERVRELMQATSVAVCLLRPEDRALELAYTTGNGADYQGLVQSAESGLRLQIMSSEQATAMATGCAQCQFLRSRPPGHCVAAPLRAGQEMLGAICAVRNGVGPFSDEETRVLTLLANSAAIAIANTRLIAAGRRQAERMAAAAERERLAADLHDSLAQTLGFVGLKTDLLQEMLAAQRLDAAGQELEHVQTAVAGAYDQVRAALTGLQEGATNEAGDLVTELAARVAAFSRSTNLPATFSNEGPAVCLLPAVTRSQLLHIVGEALSNAWQHAGATQVQVRLAQTAGELRIVVADDGRGFGPADADGSAAAGGGKRLGLRIMHARAARIGAHLEIDSRPGAGARLLVSLLKRDTDEQR